MQQYVINFVGDLRQVGSFLRVSVFFTNKTDYHDITDILMKVALNTIKQTSILREIVIQPEFNYITTMRSIVKPALSDHLYQPITCIIIQILSNLL